MAKCLIESSVLRNPVLTIAQPLATIRKTMKILTILTFFLLFASYNLNAQKLNCKKFKNGEFKILKDSISGETLIKRNGNFQTEKLFGKSETTELIVHWTNDCTYTLRPKDMSLDKFKELPKNALMTIEIIKIKENSYIQKTTTNFAKPELISEVFKIK